MHQITVPFICHQHNGSRFGNQKISAGYPDIGIEKFLAQLGARFGQQIIRIIQIARGIEIRVAFAKGVGHLLRVQMNGRHHHIAGPFAAELQ